MPRQCRISTGKSDSLATPPIQNIGREEQLPFSQAVKTWFVLASFSFYLVFAIISAAHHRLWFDEVNTALLSHLPAGQLWESLRAGADTNPPMLYYPVRLARTLLSSEELATRLPSIFEFLLMMGCIHLILRRYVGSAYALAAAFFPFLTAAGLYATEGRGYAAMLGFSSAALLLWRDATVDVRRNRSLLGLALAIALAVSNHYSAALIVVALGSGEAARTLQRRRVDVFVWMAIAAGSLPILFFRPLLPAIHTYLLSYWSKPSVREMLSALGGWKWAALILLLLLLMIGFRRQLPKWMRTHQFTQPAIPVYERVAWFAVLFSPVYGYIQGRITGGFSMRYALVMAIPVALFAGILAYRACRGTTIPALVLLAFCLAFVAERMIVPIYRPSPLEVQAAWIQKTTGALKAPVMVGDPVVFSPLYFYALSPLKSRLHYISDPDLSTKFLGTNSGDLNMSKLRKFAPLPVSDYSNLSMLGKHFYVIEDGSTWLTHQLRADLAQIKTLTCKDTWCLEEVNLR